jgi:hypothetical protein
MRHLLLFLVVVLTSFPERLGAQVPDATAVQTAAVQHILAALRDGEQLPEGPIGLDRRILQRVPYADPRTGEPFGWSYPLGELREPGQDSVLREQLGDAELRDYENAVTCATQSGRSCRLLHVVALFALAEPTLPTDSTAEVIVAVQWRSSVIKMPVAKARYSVRLQREPCGWVVATVSTLSIT